MGTILTFLTRYKYYVATISIAVIVLSGVVVFYETQRRNMISANSEMLDLHNDEVYALNQAIYLRDANIEEMAGQNNALQAQLAAQEEIIYANTNHQVLEEELADLQQQFDDLQQLHWETEWISWEMGLREMDAPLMTHATADPGKVDMIVRHFNAMYSGDLQAYLATINNSESWEYPGLVFTMDDMQDWPTDGWTWVDWMLMTFRRISEREYYRMEVKFIPDWWHSAAGEWGRQTSGHLPVWVLVQETPDSTPFLRSYPLMITSTGGENWNEWRVYDYH